MRMTTDDESLARQAANGDLRTGSHRERGSWRPASEFLDFHSCGFFHVVEDA